MAQKSDAKFNKKLISSLENDIKNLAKLYKSTRKSENWDIDRILLYKVENEWL